MPLANDINKLAIARLKTYHAMRNEFLSIIDQIPKTNKIRRRDIQNTIIKNLGLTPDPYNKRLINEAAESFGYRSVFINGIRSYSYGQSN